MLRLVVPAILILGVVAGLAACGGDRTPTATTAPPPTEVPDPTAMHEPTPTTDPTDMPIPTERPVDTPVPYGSRPGRGRRHGHARTYPHSTHTHSGVRRLPDDAPCHRGRTAGTIRRRTRRGPGGHFRWRPSQSRQLCPTDRPADTRGAGVVAAGRGPGGAVPATLPGRPVRAGPAGRSRPSVHLYQRLLPGSD